MRTGLGLLSAVIVAALTACFAESIATADAIRTKLDKGELASAVVDLKVAMQANPDAADLRLLLGRVLLIQEQPVLAELELRKAMVNPALRDTAVALAAEAMLAARQPGKLIEEWGSTRLDSSEADLSLRTTLAAAAAQTGKTDLASATLDAVLKAAPDHGRAVVLDARRLAAAGNLTGSTARLEALLVREPGNVDALFMLADLRLIVDKGDEAALALYRKVLTIKKNNLPAHSAVITVHLRKADLGAATQALAEMQKSNPSHAQTKFMEAQVAFAKADLKRARELSQQLLSAAPDSVNALQLAALVELRSNNHQRAEALLLKSQQLGSANVSARRLLAEVYIGSGQGEKALATLKPIMESSVADFQALKLGADAAMQVGDVSRAGELYAAAVKAKPDDAKVRTSMALAEIASGKVDDGLRSLRAISEAHRQDMSADVALVASLLQRNEFDAALTALDVLGTKNPGFTGLDLMRGRVHLLKRDRAAARKSFETALQKHPNSFPSVAALAMLDVSERRLPSAIQRYDDFLKSNPSPSVKSMVLRSLAGIKFNTQAPQDEVVRLLQEAVKADPLSEPAAVMLVDSLLRSRQVEAAVSAARAALTNLNEAPGVLDALGRAQMASGDLRQAAATFGKVARLQPRAATPPLRLAQIQLLSNDPKGALANYIRALTLDPDLAEAQSSLAKLAGYPGQLPSVLTAVRAMQRQAPDQAFPHRIEGDLHFARRAFDDAIMAYRKGLDKARPGRLPVRLHRSYVSLRKHSDAQQFASAWVKSHPTDVGFLLHLADMAMTGKDFASAETHYRQVVQLAPTHNTALNNLAWLLTQTKRPGAVEFAERALKASPGKSAVMDTLAHALVAERQNDRAMEVAGQVLAMEPESALFQLSMAKVFAQAGQPKRALDTLALLDKANASEAVKSEAASLRKKLGAGV